jgi:hypothetical protein
MRRGANFGIRRKVMKNLERETGIEPVTSSLGSYGQCLGERRINELQRAKGGKMRHSGGQLNTILNTTFSRAGPDECNGDVTPIMV